MSVCACNVKFSNCLWIKFPNYVSKACWWLIMGSADNAPFITQLWKLLVTNSMVERSCTTFYIHYIVDQHLIAFYVWLKISLITNEHTPRRVAARTHTPNIWDTWTNLLRSPFLAADFTCFLADSAKTSCQRQTGMSTPDSSNYCFVFKKQWLTWAGCSKMKIQNFKYWQKIRIVSVAGTEQGTGRSDGTKRLSICIHEKSTLFLFYFN